MQHHLIDEQKRDQALMMEETTRARPKIEAPKMAGLRKEVPTMAELRMAELMMAGRLMTFECSMTEALTTTEALTMKRHSLMERYSVMKKYSVME